MDWNTLLAVAIGGLIAIIPTIINNIYQVKQRKEDREEQRRKEKILILESPILKIMDSVVTLLAKLAEYRLTYSDKQELVYLMKKGQIATEDTKEEYKILEKNIDKLRIEIRTLTDLIGSLMVSLDDETMSTYNELTMTIRDYLRLTFKEEKKEDTNLESEKWQDVKFQTGTLQRLLREKLISIRDTD